MFNVYYTDQISSAQLAQLTIRALNAPVRQVCAISDQTFHINQLFSLQIPRFCFEDADGDDIHFAVKGLDALSAPVPLAAAVPWLSFDGSTLLLSGTPLPPPTSLSLAYEIRLYFGDNLTDAGDYVFQQFRITSLNHPPVLVKDFGE